MIQGELSRSSDTDSGKDDESESEIQSELKSTSSSSSEVESENNFASAEPAQKKTKIDENFKQKFCKIIKKFKNLRNGEFVVHGKLADAPTIAISIKNSAEKIRFPFYIEDAEKIITTFKKSSYGKGTATVLDTKFRNSWEMNPDEFTILNPDWDIYIKEIVISRIGKEMAIDAPFTVSLHKLLIYEKGSFFKAHRDTEKEPRMFGTLVMQLPSSYSGGELVVSHDNKTKTIDLSSETDSSCEFATCYTAFYCDCVHEVLPVKDGIRICLIYNLTLLTTGLQIPTAPRSSHAETMLDALFKDWLKCGNPTKIVYALSHKYTKENLSFENLKSTDKFIAKSLKYLAAENSIIFLLGFLQKDTHGAMNEYGFDNSYDDICLDDIEYCEEYYNLADLQLLENAGLPDFELHSMTVSFEEEAIPENCFRNVKPFKKDVQETGNEGVQVNLMFRNAALVLVPKIMHSFIKDHNYDAAADLLLGEYTKSLQEKGDETIEENLINWASLIVNERGLWVKDSKKLDTLFAALISFNKVELLQRFLDNYGKLTVQFIPVLMSQCEKYGWDSFSAQLTDMFKKLANREKGTEMLTLIWNSGTNTNEKKNVCRLLAEVIVVHLRNNYLTQQLKSAEIEERKNHIYSFCIISKSLDLDILKFAQTQPLSMAVPVLLKLSSENKNELEQYYKEAAKFYITKMEDILAEEALGPNWRSDFKSCGCSDCQLLQAFMKSNEVSEGFKIAKMRRLHLHQGMNSMTNITHVTCRVGSPQTLVVTKESAAHKLAELKLVKDLLPRLKRTLK